MVDRATALARHARRAGLVAALRRFSDLPLDQTIRLVHQGKYAEDLAEIRLHELATGTLAPLNRESDANAIMRIFEMVGCEWVSSGLFVHRLGLRRWTAQKLLGDLVDRGLLERRGVTSATRYRLARRSPARTLRRVDAR